MPLADAPASHFYLAYLGRPQDAYSFDRGGLVPGGAAFRFAESPEYQTQAGGGDVAAVVERAYQRLFNRPAEAAGLAYWSGEVAAGRMQLAQLPLAILQGAQNADRTSVQNKLEAADAFVAALDTPFERTWFSGQASADVARTWLRGFDAAPPDPAATRVSAQAAVDASNAVGTPPGSLFSLTVGTDILDATTNTTGDTRFVPSSGNDTFDAAPFTLSAADRIDGLGGRDRLNLSDEGSIDTQGLTLRGLEEVAILAGPHPEVGLAGVPGLERVDVVQVRGPMRLHGLASSVELQVDLRHDSDLTVEFSDRTAPGTQAVTLGHAFGPPSVIAAPVLHLPGIETVTLHAWHPFVTLHLDAATTLNVTVPHGPFGPQTVGFGQVVGVPGRLQVNLSGEGLADLTNFLNFVPAADLAVSGALGLRGLLSQPVTTVTAGAGGVDLVLAAGSALTSLDARASTGFVRLDARDAAQGVAFTGGSSANELRGGAGADVFTGTANGTFRFAHADFRASFGSGGRLLHEDSITDWGGGTLRLVDDGVALSLVENAAASPGVARIAQGVATFDREGSLQEKLAWTEAGLQQGGTAAAGQLAAFLHGGGRWVFVSDGVDGVTAGDALVRLAGVQSNAPLDVSGGVLVAS